MFGALGDMAKMMKNLSAMQSNMKQMQEELAKVEVTGTCRSGMAEIVMAGDMTVKKVSIAQSAMTAENRAALEDSVREAFASALQQAKMEGAKRISSAAGGLNVPGLFPGA